MYVCKKGPTTIHSHSIIILSSWFLQRKTGTHLLLCDGLVECPFCFADIFAISKAINPARYVERLRIPSTRALTCHFVCYLGSPSRVSRWITEKNSPFRATHCTTWPANNTCPHKTAFFWQLRKMTAFGRRSMARRSQLIGLSKKHVLLPYRSNKNSPVAL